MKKIILFAVVLVISFFIARTICIKQFELTKLSERASWLNSTKYVQARVVKPLETMIMDAEKDGMCLVVTSAYRTPKEQLLIYNSNKDGTVAKPGKSEHEKGRAVDFTGCPMKDGVRNDDTQRLELADDFSTLPEYQWLVDNARKYHFIQSYTEENTEITGFSAEPWHWKYNK